MRHKFFKSEYERTYKSYDDVYAFMRKTNVGSARVSKARNEGHTPFAWEDEDDWFDIPTLPSQLDWSVVLDKNKPRPSGLPAFKQKHLQFVAAYEERMRMKKLKKEEKKLKQSTSPKGSTSCDFVLGRGSPSLSRSSSITSVQSVPACMPSRHLGSPPPPGGRHVARKAVQTPSDWSKIDDGQSEKSCQTRKKAVLKTSSKASIGGSSSGKTKKNVTMKTPGSGSAAAKPSVPKFGNTFSIVSNINDPSQQKYIVSKEHVPYHKSDQPFTGFGYGNDNIETARKMTCNVRAPSNVYPSAHKASEQLKLRRENKAYDAPRPTPKPHLKEKWRHRESEYVSNYTSPDQTMQYYRRKQAQKIAEKARKACGVNRKAK